MQMSRFASVLMALTLAAPLTAAAASGEKSNFEEVDSDGDGQIAVSEAAEAGIPEQEAKREDIDGDGNLSQTDWKFVDMNPDQQSGSDSS